MESTSFIISQNFTRLVPCVVTMFYLKNIWNLLRVNSEGYLWCSQNPRPHISIAWAVGDISNRLKSVIGDEMKRRTGIGSLSNTVIFNCRFGGISCKIGNRTYEICKVKEEWGVSLFTNLMYDSTNSSMQNNIIDFLYSFFPQKN